MKSLVSIGSVSFFFASLVVLCVFLGCEINNNSIPEGMSLVWADEFSVSGEPDPEKWDYSVGGHGWGNGEVQKYTDSRENSFVKKGKLTIKAIKDRGVWTSARLKTQHKADWTYGYVEVRAKLPEGVGTWPAIWMMPVADSYGGWPRSGEIDIMEHVGFDPNMIHTSIHTQAFNHKINTHKSAFALVPDVSKKFHVYAMEWDPNYIQWFVDGDLFFRVDNPHETIREWPFDIPFYLIMNVAMGGGWGGQKGIDKELLEATMQIDYVRVYQKK